MIVFVVLEIIDLGDQIVSIHFNENAANEKAKTLNDEWVAKYPNNRKENYYVATHTVE